MNTKDRLTRGGDYSEKENHNDNCCDFADISDFNLSADTVLWSIFCRIACRVYCRTD